MNINNCNQKCTNTNGSYNCSCYIGYELAPNSLNNCIQSNNIIKLSSLMFQIDIYFYPGSTSISQCSNSGCKQICTLSTLSTVICACEKGYTLNADNVTCNGNLFFKSSKIYFLIY